ncbi:MAG: hypothetical protein ACFB50_03860 [Rubrobacteraceae bacterium]
MHRRPQGWSPRPQASHDATDHEVEREVDEIVETLEREGITDRRRLAELVRASHWGPRRFRTALRTAVAEGRIERVRRGVIGRYDLYGPLESRTRED